MTPPLAELRQHLDPATAWANFQKLVQRLDSDQRNMVRWKPEDGNLRVLASAGSGKSTSLVALIAALIYAGRVDPRQLIVTTFTRKGAQVLRSRLGDTLAGDIVENLWLGTWHSLGLQYVKGAARQKNQKWRWRSDFNIDSDRNTLGKGNRSLSSWQLWNSVLGPWDVPGTRKRGLDVKLEDLGVTVRDYALEAEVLRSRGLWSGVARGIRSRVPNFGTAWKLYDEGKKGLKAWDFGDVLSHWRADLRRAQEGEWKEDKAPPDAGWETGLWNPRAKIVLVDEAQDNSRVQLDLAKRLAGPSGRVILIGDAKQAVFNFRGAFPDLLLNADKELGAQTRELPRNYRSARKIVALGNAIAKDQPWCKGAPAVATRPQEGVITAKERGLDPWEEAERVAGTIAARIAGGASPDCFAVLNRTKSRTSLFALALLQQQVPIELVGAVSLFGSKKARAFLAYAVLARRDDGDAFMSIYNTPTRFLSKKWAEGIAKQCAKGADLTDVLANAELKAPNRQRENIGKLTRELVELRRADWDGTLQAIGDLLRPPPRPSGVTGDAADDRAEEVGALIDIARAFDSLDGFLDGLRGMGIAADEVAHGKRLERPVPPAGPRVTVSTAHAAKGREWDVVFVSMPKLVWPHQMSHKEGRVPEERRLAYVAWTRAADELHITWSRFGFPTKRSDNPVAGPSPWIKEFVKPLLEGEE